MRMPQNAQRIQLVSRAGLFTAVVAVSTMALIPDDTPTPSILGSHIFNHIAAFAVIAALLIGAAPTWRWLYAFFVANSFGVLLEVLQWLITEDREPSAIDLTLNLLGSGLGVLLAGFALRFVRSARTTEPS